MRSFLFSACAALAALASAPIAAANTQKTQLYYQPVDTSSSPSSPPTFFAEITFDPSSPTTAEVTSYEAPELVPEDAASPVADLIRIGAYDASRKAWTSAVSVTGAETFTRKGYAPHLVLDVDGARGREAVILGAAARGVAIDAGSTRDFGPKAVVRVAGDGKGPEVGKPVVLGTDGKKKTEEPEKTLLQKYWWAIGIVLILLLGGGGDK